MRRRLARTLALAGIGITLTAHPLGGQSRGAAPVDAPPERIDYLTFAQGAVPIGIGGAGAGFGANYEHAVRIIDGSPQGFTVVSQAPPDTATEFTYELPALTTFDRFAVPNILETPAPNQTFTRLVEIHGSAASATDGFVLLASATLATHKARGLTTEIPVSRSLPIRWVRLRLVGGINAPAPRMGLEFSEIIGNGRQETPALITRFSGAWRTAAPRLQLRQQGALVAGCYDGSGELHGTVTGNILRAMGVSRSDKTPSAFIVSVAPDGSIRGVRSDNRGPFRYFTLASAPASTPFECGLTSPPTLGCGSVVHGIHFDFDSAAIRADSAGVLDELTKGLKADSRATITIEGHTSDEGTAKYNQELSARRAQAVVAALVTRGIGASRLAAAGIGEDRPIATNADESGRSLNRRVEVHCQ